MGRGLLLDNTRTQHTAKFLCCFVALKQTFPQWLKAAQPRNLMVASSKTRQTEKGDHYMSLVNIMSCNHDLTFDFTRLQPVTGYSRMSSLHMSKCMMVVVTSSDINICVTMHSIDMCSYVANCWRKMAFFKYYTTS